MIQNGTILTVVDNSGAKSAICIKVLKGFKSKYAFSGDLILVSIKSLRSKRRFASKVLKGELYKALVVRTKSKLNKSIGSNDSITFLENSVILLNKQLKFIGTRIFGSLPSSLRQSKFLKAISLSSGILYF
jgi:large subunit ribosomal protein L14